MLLSHFKRRKANEFEQMAHGHTASMQKSQDLNLGSLNCWITSKKEEKKQNQILNMKKKSSTSLKLKKHN